MSSLELVGTRSFEQTVDGVVGTMVFRAPNTDSWPVSGVPVVGDPWSAGYPSLKCVGVGAVEEAFDWIITCRFNTKPQGEDMATESWDFGCEVLDTTKGMVWETAGSVCDVPVSTIYPVQGYVITLRDVLPNREAIQAATGKLNSQIFRGYAAETMLFEGAEVRVSYGVAEILTAEVQYRFVVRSRSHNEVWREARQLLIKGVPQYYQKQDPAKDYYTDEGTGDPKEGDPVYVAGTPGTSGWDKPKDPLTSKYRYETCDFAAELGITELDGDG
jgi:hypothetical protein